MSAAQPYLAQWRDVVVDYAVPGAWGRPATVRALHGVSLGVAAGGALGIVGASGCGKSTLGRALLRLLPVTAGSVWFGGQDITHWSARQLRPVRAKLQVVFQEPGATLDPRWSAQAAVAEPLRVHGQTTRTANHQALQLLAAVGLDAAMARHLPGALSGGQRQRVALARALACQPALLVLDEPVTALDTTVQAHILALLNQLRHNRGLALVFISHDLAAVAQVCSEVAVLCAGRVVECGPVAQVFGAPQHPYTQALLRDQPELA